MTYSGGLRTLKNESLLQQMHKESEMSGGAIELMHFE